MEIFKRLLVGLGRLAIIIIASMAVTIIGVFLVIGIMGGVTFIWGLLGLPVPDFSSAILVFGIPAVLIYAWKLGKK